MCIPPPSKENFCWIKLSQLTLHEPFSPDKLSGKIRLIELSGEYSFLSTDRDFVAWQNVHYKIIKSLKSRSDIYLTRPNKGYGVVILNSQDYISIMEVILHDFSKVRKIGSASTCDNSNKIEAKIQRRLLSVFKNNLISKSVYNRIKPVGSQKSTSVQFIKVT